MDRHKQNSIDLRNKINLALDKINYKKLILEEKGFILETQSEDFWKDPSSAQKLMQKLSLIQKKLEPWKKLNSDIKYLEDLIELDDKKIEDDIVKLISEINKEFDDLKNKLKMSGPYDEDNAILSIYAGAGGTDAQDWTQMLFRMYSRYAESKGFKTKLINETPGEEAGLKSITLEIDGENSYGLLKGEHGVHRLVRLSPFNSNNLRETSFAKVEVIPKIEQPDLILIEDKDLKIDVYRAGGHGGQSVNTTDSAVRITHTPTGINVAIQNERSQTQNKELALTIIRSKLAQLKIEQHKDNINDLKGENQSAEWGNQIRSYVLHPYKQVKDLRTNFETSNIESILDGDLDAIIDAYLDYSLSV